MTKTEYRQALMGARRSARASTIQAGRKMRQEFLRVASIVAKAVRQCPNKLFLTENVKSVFPRKELHDFIVDTVKGGRGKAVKLISDINKKHLFDMLDKIPGHGLSKDKITSMFDSHVEKAKLANSKIKTEIVNNSYQRTFRGTGFSYRPDGTWGETTQERTYRLAYPLSHSVWDTVNHTEESLLNVVWGGLAQGRDIRSVSQDIMAFAQSGPSVIPGRWGNLVPGTREYIKRLGKVGPDYRAIRLYRSEMYRNMQEEAIAEGQNNPACTGEYDWIRFGGREDTCDVCMSLAAGSPYTKDTVPEYPHPNCLCSISPRLDDDAAFIQKLREFVNGDDTQGAHEIEEWARENGLMEDSVSSPFADDESKPYATLMKHDKIDYSHLTFEEAIKQETNRIMQLGIDDKNGNEYLSYMSSNGEVLGTWKGVGNTVNPRASELWPLIRNMPDRSVIAIHCHVDGSLFSPLDIYTALHNNKLNRLIVTLQNGNSYFIAARNDILSYEIIELNWNVIYGNLEIELKKTFPEWRELLQTEKNNITLRVNEILKTMYDWEFDRL